MKILNTGKCEIMLVDLPERTVSHDVCDAELEIIFKDEFHTLKRIVPLPEGYTYTILGRAKELTEEQLRPIMRRPAIQPKYGDPYEFIKAKDLFSDFLKSVGVLLENPYEEPYCEQGCRCTEQQVEDCVVHLKRWKEAQQNVKNPLIIKVEKV